MKTNIAEEKKNEMVTFNPGPQWSEVKKEFTVKFDNKDLAELPQVTNWATTLAFTLSPGSGTLFVDDVKILAK